MNNELILDLYKKNCIKFGKFTLKSGEISPIYVDLKAVISYNFLINKIVNSLQEKIKLIDFDIICGIPYGAIVYTSILANKYNYKQILLRKEMKKYGTKKIIEGEYLEKSKCILIEDTITTGSSLEKFISILESNNIEVVSIFVICDRRTDKSKLKKYNLQSLFTLKDIISVFKINNIINENNMHDIINFFKPSFLKDNIDEFNIKSFEYRYNLSKTNNITKKLMKIMIEKKTNLCFSADIIDIKKLIEIVGKIGKHICLLKIHYDIIDNFNEKVGLLLKKMAEKLNFLIFEDRKYNDIGNTFNKQIENKKYNFKKWCDIISIKSLNDRFYKFNNIDLGIIIISDMSNEINNYFLDDIIHEYNNFKIKNINENSKDIVGIVTQKNNINNPSLLYFTPGVRINHENDVNNDQKYRTVEQALVQDNCDVIIVGSGIYESKDVEKTAEIYKMLGWTSYKKKINQ